MCTNYAQFPRDLVASFRAVMALATRHPLLAVELRQQIQTRCIQTDTLDPLSVILLFADAKAVSGFLAYAESHGRVDTKSQYMLTLPTDRVPAGGFAILYDQAHAVKPVSSHGTHTKFTLRLALQRDNDSRVYFPLGWNWWYPLITQRPMLGFVQCA